MDKDKKIEIQQKLIEQLSNENMELREKLLYEESSSEDNIEKFKSEYDEKYGSSIEELTDSKKKLDNLVEQINKLKSDYSIYFEMYKQLTR